MGRAIPRLTHFPELKGFKESVLVYSNLYCVLYKNIRYDYYYYFYSALCSIQNISFLEDIVKAYKQSSGGAESEVNLT